jgi:hypothetical protein
MRVVVYNLDWRVKEELLGSFENATFKYKINQLEIPIVGWKFGGEDVLIPMDYNITYPANGGERQAFYQFDGKDYKQLKISDAPTDKGAKISFSDSTRTWRDGRRKLEAMLTDPSSLEGFAKMMGWLFLAILMIATTYNAQTLNNISNKQFSILNASVNVASKSQTLCINQTQLMTKEADACISTLRNVSARCAAP